VRAELASASRTGKPPADLKATMTDIQRALALQEDIDASWASLRGHLGWFADALIPDADGATRSLAAIRELQLALNEQVNENRLADLARADAFVTDELTEPATAISETISAWVGLARRFEGPDPMAFAPPELAQWAIVTVQSLDVLDALHEAAEPLGVESRTADQLFDDAIARDRVDQLRSLLGLAAVNKGEEQ
jgi:signal transduction histidine kinase